MKKLWFHVPKLNYCDMRRSTGSFPIISDLLKVVSQYGNLAGMCPFKVGEYYMKGFGMDHTTLQSFFGIGSYLSVIQVLEENRKSTNIVKFDFGFDRK
jgi:hypothetical protein